MIIIIITCIHSIISAESAHLDQRLCEAAPQEAEHGDHEDLCNHNDEHGDGDGCREFNNDDDGDNNDGGGGIPFQWIMDHYHDNPSTPHHPNHDYHNYHSNG